MDPHRKPLGRANLDPHKEAPGRANLDPHRGAPDWPALGPPYAGPNRPRSARKHPPLAGPVLGPNTSNFDKGFIWENSGADSKILDATMAALICERQGRLAPWGRFIENQMVEASLGHGVSSRIKWWRPGWANPDPHGH